MARSGGDALRIHERRGFFGSSDVVRNWLAQQQDQGHRQQQQEVVNARTEKFRAADTSWISDIPHCMVFTPSVEEFEDPLAYISSIAPKASQQGICKIVSPIAPGVPAGRVLMRENPGFKFNTRVQPMRLSDWDSVDNKVTFLISAQRYTFAEFEKMANKFYSRKFCSAAVQPHSFVEAEFWKEILSGKSDSIQYASDVDGSAFSTSPDDPLARSNWNLKVFSSLSRSTLRLLDTIIPGVTEPMLYIGMLFSMFAWHVEDHYLYSINYHHCGASKTWYGVPGASAQRFESVVKENVYDSKLLNEHGQGAAYDFLIGKTTMFPPSVLLDHGVPVYKAVQAPGEFVVTFPRSYHAGFSHGFNCGEAVNFAMADWFPYGAAACRRYCLLNRMPLLPHEELLWKEAEALEYDKDCSKTDSRQTVPLSFLRLMSFQHKVRWLLKSRGAAVYTSRSFPVNVPCSLCKHACYVSFLTCKCFPEPTCLNHAAEMRRCECGNDRRVILHKDIRKMDELAQKIQNLAGSEQALAVIDDGMSFQVLLEEDIRDAEDYSLYVPFESIDAPDLIQPHQQTSYCCSSGVTAQIDVSLMKPEYSCTVPKDEPGAVVVPEKQSGTVSSDIAKHRARVSLCFKKQPVQERTDFSRNVHGVKAVQTCSGEGALLLKDIVSVLRISGSLDEITRGWERAAKSMGLSLSFSYAGNGEIAVPNKAFQRLKQILPALQADALDRLYETKLSSGGWITGKRKEQAECGGSHSKRQCQSSSDSTARFSSSSSLEGSGRRRHSDGDQLNNNSSGCRRHSDGDQLINNNNSDNHNSKSSNATKRVLTKNGKRVNVNGEEIRSDRDSSSVGDCERRVVPRFRVKGPSLPPGYIARSEGSGENNVSRFDRGQGW